MTPHELAVFQRLLAAARRQLTHPKDHPPHAAIVIQTEYTGYCKSWKPCTATCRELTSVIADAEVLVAEAEAGRPVQVQMELLEAS